MRTRAALIDAAQRQVHEALDDIRAGRAISPGSVALWFADRGVQAVRRLPDGRDRELAFSLLRQVARETKAGGALILYDAYTVHLDRPEDFFRQIGGRHNVAQYSLDDVVRMGFGRKIEALFCIAQMPAFAYRIKQPYERFEDGIMPHDSSSQVLDELRGAQVIFPDDPTELVLTTEHDQPR